MLNSGVHPHLNIWHRNFERGTRRLRGGWTGKRENCRRKGGKDEEEGDIPAIEEVFVMSTQAIFTP